MKKVSTYLPSLILSVLLVFALMLSTAALLLNVNFKSEKLKELSAKNNLGSKIYIEIEKYYKDKYNSSGIPSNVYMDAIDESYLKNYEDVYIDSAFAALNGNGKMSISAPKNQELEKSIENFFLDFVDKNNYQKDEKFEDKLKSAKENAYLTVGSFCDVYKFSAMSSHGVLPKLAKIYSNRIILTFISITITLGIIFMLLIVNRKKKVTTMYWLGISAVISGFMSIIPSIYLIATKYFDSFSIKQAPVFTAFTSLMYKVTAMFIAVNSVLILIGIVFIAVYGLRKQK